MTNKLALMSDGDASDAFVVSSNVVLEWRGWRKQRIIYCAKYVLLLDPNFHPAMPMD